jgi:DMSO/TMAO reductase YedYZ heme-binding membrane subunit
MYNLAMVMMPFIFIFIAVFKPLIEKFEWLLILLSTLIALVSFLVPNSITNDFVLSGQISLSLLMIVILVAIFKRGHVLRTYIDPVRGDLAISAMILLLPHIVKNIELSLSGFNSTGSLAFFLMLPLMVTSLKSIRKKMTPSAWYKLHKMSYVAYVFLYLHVGFDLWLSPLTIYPKLMSWPIHIMTFGYVSIKLYRYFERKKVTQ